MIMVEAKSVLLGPALKSRSSQDNLPTDVPEVPEEGPTLETAPLVQHRSSGLGSPAAGEDSVLLDDPAAAVAEAAAEVSICFGLHSSHHMQPPARLVASRPSADRAYWLAWSQSFGSGAFVEVAVAGAATVEVDVVGGGGTVKDVEKGCSWVDWDDEGSSGTAVDAEVVVAC